MFPNVSIALSETQFQFSFLVGCTLSSVFEAPDFITFEHEVNGGPWSKFYQLRGGPGTNYMSQDADFDGVGDRSVRPLYNYLMVINTSLTMLL